MSLELNYIDSAEGVQDAMSAESTGGNAVSDDSRITTGTPDNPYATLEDGVWVLDGSRKILPEKPVVGFWSTTATGEDRRFSEPPVITLLFPSPYSATGMTFTFSPSTDQWCDEIHVSWYNGQSLLIGKTYFPDSATWILDETVESFDQIRIQFVSTNKPHNLAKVQRIEIGRTILFSADELVSVRIVNEIDPSLCVLSADTMDFHIRDTKDRELIPQENQRVELMKNGELYAVQYIVSSTREARNQYKISCQSVIGLLGDTFLGGIYNAVPMADLVAEILDSWPFEIDQQFAGETITGYIPVCTRREALQQIAFAVGAVVSTQKSTKIRFLPVPTITTAKFTESDVFLGGSVKTSPRVAKIQVTAHAYAKTDTEQQLVQEEEITGEDVLITFDAPHYDYTIEGGTITGQGVNWITVTANGKVTVTGKDYVHTETIHSKRNPAAVAKEQSNYISVSDVTIVNSGNVQAALNRLYNVYQYRQTTEQEVVIDGQSAGEMAASVTPWGSKTQGFIASMDSELTQNGHTATITIQGVEVSLESVFPYAGELWAGDLEVLY